MNVTVCAKSIIYNKYYHKAKFTGIIFTADTPGTDVVGGLYYRPISVSYSFDCYVPIIPLNNIPLSSSTRIPVNTP
ncbi:MAG: hypothetical protein COB59_05175 [Rhodospirillaceae bacterium]|nr:MAG: hypothetical protein COB59_05175 [Rhodospirillaceae bacterium]